MEISRLSREQLEEIIKDQNIVIEKLCSQLSTSTVSKKEFEDKLEDKLKLYKNITNDFNCKISVIKILANFFEDTCDMWGRSGFNIHGSFVRQLIELPFNIDNLNLSNPIDRDIDILLDIGNNKAAINVIEKFIEKFSSDNETNLKIINFKKCTVPIIDLNESKKSKAKYTPGVIGLQNIPHYKFNVDYLGYKIEIDIMSRAPDYSELWNPIDFEVNAVRLDNNGFKFNSDKFFDVLESVKKRVTKTNIDLEKLQSVGLKNPDRYKSCMLQIVFYLSERMKIVEAGYTIESKTFLPDIQIVELKTGECPQIKLVDGSWISLIEFTKKVIEEKILKLELVKKTISLTLTGRYISIENQQIIRDMVKMNSEIYDPSYSY